METTDFEVEGNNNVDKSMTKSYSEHQEISGSAIQRRETESSTNRTDREAGGSSFNCLANKCMFRCDKCSFQSRVKSFFNAHYFREHGVKLLLGDIDGFADPLAYFNCKMCGKPLLRDLETLSNHIGNYHNRMKRQEYRVARALVKFDTFKHGSFTLKKCMVYIRRSGHVHDYLNALLRPLVPVVDLKFLPSTTTHPAQAIPRSQCTDYVADLCILTCPGCKTEFNNSFRMRAHVKKCKGSRSFSISDVAEARFHACRVCARRILCDVDKIKSHAKGHGVSWKKYLSMEAKK